MLFRSQILQELKASGVKEEPDCDKRKRGRPKGVSHSTGKCPDTRCVRTEHRVLPRNRRTWHRDTTYFNTMTDEVFHVWQDGMEPVPYNQLRRMRAPDIEEVQVILDKLIMMRAEMGLSQKQLAHRSGISQPYLNDIENGKYRPGTAILQLYAKGLGKVLRCTYEIEDRIPGSDAE